MIIVYYTGSKCNFEKSNYYFMHKIGICTVYVFYTGLKLEIPKVT